MYPTAQITISLTTKDRSEMNVTPTQLCYSYTIINNAVRVTFISDRALQVISGFTQSDHTVSKLSADAGLL